MTMRKTALVIFLLLSTWVHAQEKSKFNYGFAGHYNHSLIKPVARDNFLSKPGVGFSTFLEFDFTPMLAVNAGFGFSNTKIEHESLFYTHSVNSIDLPISFTLQKNHSAGFHIYAGIMPTYIVQALEKPLVGPTNEIGNFSSLPFQNRMDYGLHLGFGIELKPGSRLKVGYFEFLNSNQSTNKIGLKHDHLQVSLEVRFRDIIKTPDLEYEQQKSELQELKESGCILFVVTTKLPSNFAREMTDVERLVLDSLRDLSVQFQVNAIRSEFNALPFAIIKDTDYPAYLRDNNSSLLLYTSESLQVESPFWPCMLGEHVYKLNDKATTGIHLYRKNNQPFTPPFTGFVPYRTPDKEFKNRDEIFSMVMRFNQNLKLMLSEL